MYKGRFLAVILAAGGAGERFGGECPKQFTSLGDRSVLETAAGLFAADARVDEIIAVVPKEYTERTEISLRQVCLQKKLSVVPGGADRAASVNAGLAAVTGSDGLVLIHDAARPFTSTEVVDRVLAAALRYGAAVPAVPVTDTIYETRQDGEEGEDSPRFALRVPNRASLRAVQTPQGFDVRVLREAHEKAQEAGLEVTDDGMPVLSAGRRVAVVAGESANIKITTQEDMPQLVTPGTDPGSTDMRAHVTTGTDPGSTDMRVGFGFDAHRFAEDRPLILGGIRIPFEKGLAGHSDADVLTHALMDAILGALRAGDIGQRFPDTDDAYKGVSSLLLLGDVVALMDKEGYELANCDLTLVAERPKMAPYRGAVEESLAAALGTEPENVSLKATTTEKLGFTGREEGIAAEAAVLLRRK